MQQFNNSALHSSATRLPYLEEEASTKNQQHASIKVDVELKQQVAFPAFTQLMGFSLLSMVVNSMMVCAKDMLGPSKGKHISHRLLVKTPLFSKCTFTIQRHLSNWNKCMNVTSQYLRKCTYDYLHVLVKPYPPKHTVCACGKVLTKADLSLLYVSF